MNKVEEFLLKYSNNIVLINLDFFEYLSSFYISKFNTLNINFKGQLDYGKFTKITLQEKIDILKQFYNYIKIDIDIDKLISDGTINIFTYDNYDNENLEEKIKYLYQGSNTYDNGHKVINVTNNGYVTDILIIVHELSHFRNQPDNARGQVNHLFTESLAYADEIIAADFLCKLGYEKEVKEYMKFLFVDKYSILFKQNKLFKILNEYKNGIQSNLNIQELNNTNLESVFLNTFNLLSIAISPELFMTYKTVGYKDINELYDDINKDDALIIFNKIGLNELDDNHLNKLFNDLISTIDYFNQLTFDTINARIVM